MADPISLGLLAVSTAATVGGGIASASGAKYSAGAKANMYEYQAGIAKLNESIEKQNADYARKSGEVVASQIGVRARQQMGLIKSGQGASGIDVNSGTAVTVREGQAKAADFDQALARSNAARTAYGFETGAITQKANQDLSRMSAEASRTAGDIAMTSSILGSVGSVAGKWTMASSSFGSPSQFLGNAYIPGNWGEQS